MAPLHVWAPLLLVFLLLCHRGYVAVHSVVQNVLDRELVRPVHVVLAQCPELLRNHRETGIGGRETPVPIISEGRLFIMRASEAFGRRRDEAPRKAPSKQRRQLTYTHDTLIINKRRDSPYRENDYAPGTDACTG